MADGSGEKELDIAAAEKYHVIYCCGLMLNKRILILRFKLLVLVPLEFNFSF